jgi:hypothetical protein
MEGLRRRREGKEKMKEIGYTYSESTLLEDSKKLGKHWG